MLIDLCGSGSSRSGGAPSQLTATFMSNLIESGDLQRHIFETLQPTYARRYQSMISAIEEHLLPLGVRLPQTSRDVVGGYFIWLSLPAPIRAEEVAMRAQEEENLIIAPGPMFAVYSDEQAVDLERKVRVCFSWEQEAMLAEGIQRLAQVIVSMQRIQRQQGKATPPPRPGGNSFLVEQYR